MEFVVLSMNYQNTPIEIRDKVALSDTKKMELYAKLHEVGIDQAVLLSTCNRSEVYMMVEEEPQTMEALNCFLSMFFPLSVVHHVSMNKGQEAIRFLFEVTAGLQSLVVGEDQILGQVVDAMQFSKEMGCQGKQISKLFQEAITSAKKMKTSLRISEHPISLSYIGIQYLRHACGLKNKKVLVLGSGNTAELAMKYLYDDGVQHVWNCNRSFTSAQKLKEKFPNIEICDFDQRYDILTFCNIVISATSSPHMILCYDEKMEFANSIYMLDLASPRDIDPAFPHVCNIDTLKEIAQEHKQQRVQKVMEGKRMLQEDVNHVMKWLTTSKMDHTIQTLQEQIDEVVQDTYAILNRKLQMNERERFILKKTLVASMQRFMKEPIQKLKRIDEKEQRIYQSLIEDLFVKEKKGELS